MNILFGGRRKNARKSKHAGGKRGSSAFNCEPDFKDRRSVKERSKSNFETDAVENKVAVLA
jgi:hypothetical protein|tara:strand:+ start:409 stop:591 length:183 start_codon:yes stop_codon:yes gene_type:complete